MLLALVLHILCISHSNKVNNKHLLFFGSSYIHSSNKTTSWKPVLKNTFYEGVAGEGGGVFYEHKFPT